MTSDPSLPAQAAANIETAKSFLDLLVAGDMEAVADLFAEDGILEFPFRPAGANESVKGQAAIRAYFLATKGYKKPESYPIKAIYPGLDPNLLFVEFEGNLVNTLTGERYSNDYIVLFRFRDGKIVQFREFFDSLHRAQHDAGSNGQDN